MDEADGVVGHFPASAVDSAATGNSYVMLSHGKEEGSPAAIRVFDVVKRIERAKDDGTTVEVEGHSAFEIEAPRHIQSCGEEQRLESPSAVVALRGAVDCCL